MEPSKAPTESWDETKRLIVASSAKVFHRYGFKKTTMDDLAKVLRKGKSSIYYYFKNKEELFEAVVEMEIAHLKKLLESKIKQTDPPQDKLATYIVTRMQVIRNMVNYWDVKSNETYSGIEFIARLRRKYDNQEIDYIITLLTEGIEQGSFRIKNPRLSAIAIVTAMKGLESPLFEENFAESEQDEHIKEIINILFFGLIIRPTL